MRDRPIRTFCASADGGLWIANDRGQLGYLGPKGSRMVSEKLPRRVIDSIVEDREGAIWLSFVPPRASETTHDEQPAVCRIKDGVITAFGRSAGFDDNRCSLTIDHAGSVWSVQTGEIARFHDGHFEKARQRAAASARIIAAKDGGLWVAASNGLFRFNEGGSLTRCEGSGANFAGFPTVMLEDRTGALWIGTMPDGLFRYTASRGVERVATSYPEINCLAEDREGNIWVGTAGGGVNRVTPRAVTFEGDATGFPQQAIQVICEDRDGTLWAATQNGALMSRTANGGWQTKSNWPTGVTAIASDPRGGIWVGSRRRSLHHLSNGRVENWTPEEGLSSHTVGLIVVARDGAVWLAEEGPVAIQRFKDGKFTPISIPNGIGRLETMAEDATGRIWVGTVEGSLLRLDPNATVDVTPRAAPHVALRALHPAADGTLWLGYRGAGIGRLKDGEFTRVSTADGLYSDSVVHLISDGAGWLWCGGEDGLFKVRVQALVDLAERRTASVQSVHYGAEAGLPQVQVTGKAWGSAIQTADGRIWIPMGTALVTVDPRRAREILEPPAVFLTQVRVDGAILAHYRGIGGSRDFGRPPETAALPLSLPLHTAPIRQKVEFDFTALSFAAPENVQFRYRLEPFDEDWISARETRSASYVRVPAGRYLFRVQACNSDGVWNETGSALALVVAPFVWQTWWFRAAAVLGFTAFTTLVVRRVSHRRLQWKVQRLRQEMTLEKERSRIARDLHDDAGNRLTRVALLSKLALRDRAQPEQAASHLEQLAVAAREATDAFDEIVWSVNPHNDNLAELVSYLGHYAHQLCQTAGIACVLDAPVQLPHRSVATDVRHHLFLAAKEAIHNAVRHAQATEVRVSVQVTDEALTIAISDNGRGLSTEATAPGADGMRNFRERMGEIGGRFEIDTRPGAGTRLTFGYPWRHPSTVP